MPLNLGLAFYFINPETPIRELGDIHRLFDETPQTPRFYPVHNKHSDPLPLHQVHLYQVQIIIQYPSSGLLGMIWLPGTQQLDQGKCLSQK